MRIFVVGNINAGKTQVVNQLIELFPNYTVISIDQYRMQYSDGTLEQEEKTQQKFANDIIATEDAIIEYSGGSKITNLFINDLRRNSFVVIEVMEDVNICLERIRLKDFSKIPYPKFDEKLEDTILRLDKEYKNNCIKTNFIDKYIHKYNIKSNCDLNTLPLKQYEIAINIANLFSHKNCGLISYGSMGRGELSEYSDVDLFLLCDKGLDYAIEQLKTLYTSNQVEWIVQKNQIDIYLDDQLIEITVIKSIEEISLFYIKSEIKNVSKTILLDTGYLLHKLESLVNNHIDDFGNEVTYTIERLKYYVKSLSRVKKKQDLYKYYFHTNIVIHEYLRLSYFLHGKREYSYLPKNGMNYISDTEWSILKYDIGDDQSRHISEVKQLADQIIRQTIQYMKK